MGGRNTEGTVGSREGINTMAKPKHKAEIAASIAKTKLEFNIVNDVITAPADFEDCISYNRLLTLLLTSWYF